MAALRLDQASTYTPEVSTLLQHERQSSARRMSPSFETLKPERSRVDSQDSVSNHSSSDLARPIPNESAPPPLPNERPPSGRPTSEDDGWQPVWSDGTQAFYFYNRFTQATQWDNPRVPHATTIGQQNTHKAPTHAPGTAAPSVPRTRQAELDESPLKPAVAGGYNPAIHGDYDPDADYNQPVMSSSDLSFEPTSSSDPLDPQYNNDPYGATANFNRFTGRFQSNHLTPENFNDENKSKRQMNAFFDVDAAANRHDGRSLRAERAGKKLSKEEVKAFRDKRKSKKEERRRAWLKD